MKPLNLNDREGSKNNRANHPCMEELLRGESPVRGVASSDVRMVLDCHFRNIGLKTNPRVKSQQNVFSFIYPVPEIFPILLHCRNFIFLINL